MKILKNKLLGIVNTENELEFDENPFVRLIRINNTVYYFRGLYMKLWATGPVHYRTLKINKSYSFSYGRGVIRNSDGQEAIHSLNCISDGKRDSDGYLSFTPSSDAWGIPMDTVVFRVKEGSTPDKLWIKAPSGTTEDGTETLWGEAEVDCYQVDTSTSNEEFTNYYILKLNTPGTGYVDFTDTVGPCEGKKIYCHDEYFIFDSSAYSAVTKIEFSKEVTEIPLGAFSNLYNMTEISLPQKLTQIGRTSFWYCQSLSSITIPENVTFIDAETFNRCDNLTDIYFDNYLVNLPANSPWGAPNAIVRCRDGYYEGPIVYACMKNEFEPDSYYRYCWGVDIVNGVSGETRYAFVGQDDYDTFHNDYLSSPSQGALWEENVEDSLSHVNGILYVENISGDTAYGYFTEHPVIGNKAALCLASDGLFTYYEKDGELLTYSSRTFQHYDFLDYTDSTYGPLKGYCNRIGYAPLTDEPNIQFMTRWEYDLGNESIADGYDIVNPYEPLEYYYIKQDDSDSYHGLNFIFKGYVDIYNDYNRFRPRVYSSYDNHDNIKSNAILMHSSSIVEGSMIAEDTLGGWLPVIYKRFEVLDITIGNKTYYAFCEADKVDRYMQEYSGDSFDVNGIDIFTSNASMYTYHGYNGREYNSYQTIIYTDSLNIYTAYTDHGGFSVPTDGGAISYGIDGGIYELITISGNSIVSALTFYNGYAVQDDDMTHYSNFNHYPSKDKVIGDVTYYCFSDGDGDIYLTDISEGTKMRVYKKASSNMGPLSNYRMYFISGSTPIENVTENSGNTLTIHESNGVDTINVSLYNLEGYNKVIDGITFYAYIVHDAYKTAYRILSNQESGITDVNDDRLLLAICNENKNTATITEDTIMMVFLTDISQGPKTQYYAGQYTLAHSSPGSTDLDPIFDQLGKVDISNNPSEFDVQITVSNNPNLDNDIAYEIEHMSSGNSSSDSGTNVTSMEITITSPNGVDTYPTTVMTFNADGTKDHTAVRFAPYDYYDASTSTQYYAFIWEGCYNQMLKMSGTTVDAYDTEFIQTLIGQNPQIGNYNEFDDYFLTSENSMNIFYVTHVETGSYPPDLYLRSVSIDWDAETGEPTAQWGGIEYYLEAYSGQTTIQNYPSGFVMAGSGDGDEEELLSNAISHKNWFVRGSSNGTSDYSVQSMILSGYNESVYNCVRFEPYDFDKNGVHYYAFIDSNCYNGIGDVVGYSVDVTNSEMVKMIIGVNETTTQVEEGSGDTPGSSYDSLVTSENSMDIIYLTSIETSPSNNMSCYAYKRDLYIGTDAETGDAYVMIRPLSEGTSATVNWMTKSYSFTLEEDTDGE